MTSRVAGSILIVSWSMMTFCLSFDSSAPAACISARICCTEACTSGSRSTTAAPIASVQSRSSFIIFSTVG